MIHALLLAAAITDASALFQAEHAAVGGSAWNRIAEIVEHGTLRGQGLTSPYTTYIDPRTGYSKSTATVAGTTQGSGYDAQGAWSQQDTLVEPLDDAAATASAKTAAYIARNGWWNPQSDPATLSSVHSQSESGKTYDMVHVVPQGGDPVDVWLDSSTHLIAKTVQTNASRVTTTTTYGDYRSTDGVMYPFATTVGTGDPKYDQVAHVDRVELKTELTVSDLQRPRNQRTGSIAGGSATTIPFDLDSPERGHIIVAASVNGSRPLHLIFDTGGSNVVTPQVAREIGLHGSGSIASGGAGESQVSLQLATGTTLHLGNATVAGQQFAILPLPPSIVGITGRYAVDGIIGYEVLKNFVVSIDYANKRLTLTDPKAFDPTESGAAIHFKSATIPVIPLTFDGVAGSFMFDTGNAFYPTISQEFVDAHKLASRLPGSVLVQSSGNIGGAIRSRLTRPSSIQIGSYTMTRPVFTVTTTKQGALAGTAYSGNIGESIISRFTVTLDYDHSIIYLKPNTRFHDPFIGSRDGMSLYRPSLDRISVGYVNPGSPAAQAGIATGDEILAVNGKPARIIGLGDIASYEASHLTISITFSHGDMKQTKMLHLRELVQ